MARELLKVPSMLFFWIWICTVQGPLAGEPLGVCPPNPINHLLLALQARPDVYQLVDLNQKVVEYAPRQYPAGSLSQQVDFAEQ